jgi:hypothetical protein
MDPKLLSPDSKRILLSPKQKGSVILRNKKYRHNDDKRERGKTRGGIFRIKKPNCRGEASIKVRDQKTADQKS